MNSELGKYLDYERDVAEIVKIRSAAKEPPKLLELLLSSSGGTALITIVIGGFFTALITSNVQKAEKDRDFQNEILKSYSQHLLALNQKDLGSRLDTLQSSLRLVGNVVNRAQARIDIDSSRFARRLDEDLNKKNFEQQQEVRRQFNELRVKWSEDKGTLEPLVGYYFGADSRAAWQATVRSLDGFLQCAEAHVQSGDSSGQESCEPLKKLANVSIEKLVDSLVNAPSPKWIKPGDIGYVRTLLAEEGVMPQKCPTSLPKTSASEVPRP